jgi:hypothetical protein
LHQQIFSDAECHHAGEMTAAGRVSTLVIAVTDECRRAALDVPCRLPTVLVHWILTVFLLLLQMFRLTDAAIVLES